MQFRLTADELLGSFFPSPRPWAPGNPLEVKSPIISPDLQSGKVSQGSRATLMLTDACMIWEGSKVRLQGTLPSDYQLEPPVRLVAPGAGCFGYAIPFTRQARIYYPELCQQCPTPSDPLRRRKNETMT